MWDRTLRLMTQAQAKPYGREHGCCGRRGSRSAHSNAVGRMMTIVIPCEDVNQCCDDSFDTYCCRYVYKIAQTCNQSCHVRAFLLWHRLKSVKLQRSGGVRAEELSSWRLRGFS